MERKYKQPMKIGGIVYTVEEVPVVIVNGNRNNAASCDHNISHIQILETVSEERKRDLLAHEVMHAIFYEAGYEDDDQEEMVNRLAKVFRSVLDDNYIRKPMEEEVVDIPATLFVDGTWFKVEQVDEIENGKIATLDFESKMIRVLSHLSNSKKWEIINKLKEGPSNGRTKK